MVLQTPLIQRSVIWSILFHSTVVCSAVICSQFLLSCFTSVFHRSIKRERQGCTLSSPYHNFLPSRSALVWRVQESSCLSIWTSLFWGTHSTPKWVCWSYNMETCLEGGRGQVAHSVSMDTIILWWGFRPFLWAVKGFCAALCFH